MKKMLLIVLVLIVGCDKEPAKDPAKEPAKVDAKEPESIKKEALEEKDGE